MTIAVNDSTSEKINPPSLHDSRDKEGNAPSARGGDVETQVETIGDIGNELHGVRLFVLVFGLCLSVLLVGLVSYLVQSSLTGLRIMSRTSRC